MCLPLIAAGIAAVGSALTIHGQNKAVSAQAAAINQQNEIKAQEIAVAHGKELTENAQRAALERSAMRASAAESGINLQAGSFLSALQTSAANESNINGTIIYNEKVQQRARQAEARSAMSQLQKTTGLGAVLKIGGSAASAYMGAGGKFGGK